MEALQAWAEVRRAELSSRAATNTNAHDMRREQRMEQGGEEGKEGGVGMEGGGGSPVQMEEEGSLGGSCRGRVAPIGGEGELTGGGQER